MRIRLFRTENFRLTAIFTGLLVAVALIVSIVIYSIVNSAFNTEVLLNASNDLAAIQNGYDSEGLSEAKEIVRQRLAGAAASDFVVLQTSDGKKVAGNLSPVTPTIGTVRLPILMAPVAGKKHRRRHEILGHGKMIAGGLYAFVGEDLFVLHSAEENALSAVGWVFTITLILAIGGGTLLSHSFLNRMDTITRTCDAIMDGRLSDRIPMSDADDELNHLATVINKMLDRISALMDNVRQIGNDIAHDLRTPLSRLLHRIELTREQSTTAEEYRNGMDRLADEVEHILMTFSALLRIGEIEAGAIRVSFQTVDMDVLVRNLGETYRPVIEDNGKSLEISTVGPAFVSGNRELLSQLFVNLIENAIAHTNVGAHIAFGLKRSSDGIYVSVADNGPGIPDFERDKVFRRFYRLDKSRSTSGSGLGLSLVAAIANIHDAIIVLDNNSPGLRVTATFRNAKTSPSDI